MTINHHPGDELILDYTSGALGESWSLAVATHLAVCPQCRQSVSLMEDVGGSLLDTAPAQPLDGAFEALSTRLEGVGQKNPSRRAPGDVATAKPVLPQPLRRYLGCDVEDVPWQRLGMGAFQKIIPTGEEGATARLLRIPAGRPVPVHSHVGLELTLVLCGAFSDVTGHYGPGDFQEADEALEHQPHAAPAEDCICLAVTSAPLRFKSLTARLIQPFLQI